MCEEKDMDIIYAAEKPSIAKLLSEHIREPIGVDDIDVIENPDETGSFRIDWRLKRFLLSPSGQIAADELELL
jgi:hypothetical protein